MVVVQLNLDQAADLMRNRLNMMGEGVKAMDFA